MRRALFAPYPSHRRALVTGVLALVCGACRGGGSATDGSPGDDGGPGAVVGFVPQVRGAQDAGLPGPRDPVPCGEWGLAYAEAVATSPDGTLLAVSGARRRLLSTSDWHEVRRLEDALARTESVQRLAFAANASVLVEMTTTGPLGLWRVADGSFMYGLDFDLPAHRARWQQVAVSDAHQLALSDGNTLAMWDVDQRAVAYSLAPTQGQVGALALSQKGDVLAMVEGEVQDTDAAMVFASARISLWDTTRARLLRTISFGRASVPAIALSPDANTLAALVQSSECQPSCLTTIDFYRTSDGLAIGQAAPWTAGPEAWPATRLSYLPDGQSIAVVYPTPTSGMGLALIRASDGALLNLMPFAGDLVFTPDGKLVSPGNSIQIRRVSDGTILDLIPASTDNQAPRFSPDGQVLASVDGDDVVLWRVGDGTVADRFSGLGKDVRALAFSPDGRTLASGGKDAMVRIWDLDHVTEPLAHKQGLPVMAVAFSPDGDALATGDDKGNIYLREARTGTATNVLYGQASVSALAFSPDGTWMVSGGTAPALRLWDARTGQAMASASHGAGVVALAMSPDGSRVASAAAKAQCAGFCAQDEGDTEIRIWRITDGALVFESTIPTVPQDFPWQEGAYVNAHAAVWGLAFAPDGRALLTAGPQSTGHVYRLPEGDTLASFGSFFAGTPFAVSPDASRIVIGSSPIQLWCANITPTP